MNCMVGFGRIWADLRGKAGNGKREAEDGEQRTAGLAMRFGGRRTGGLVAGLGADQPRSQPNLGLRERSHIDWRGSFQSHDFVHFVHDGFAVLVAQGQFGVAQLLDFRLRGGEGVAVFLPLEFEFILVELEAGGGMAAALEGDEVAAGLPQQLEALRAFGEFGELLAHGLEVLGGDPVGGDIGDGAADGALQFLDFRSHFGEHCFDFGKIGFGRGHENLLGVRAGSQTAGNLRRRLKKSPGGGAEATKPLMMGTLARTRGTRAAARAALRCFAAPSQPAV